MPGGLTSEISLQQLRALPVVRYLIYEFDWTEFLGGKRYESLVSLYRRHQVACGQKAVRVT
jgi:hypothetical protein